MLYAVAPEVRIEQLNEAWVAYSPRSGETLILNDESAAILDILIEGTCDVDELCAILRRECGVSQPDLCDIVTEGLARLGDAGLVRAIARRP